MNNKEKQLIKQLLFCTGKGDSMNKGKVYAYMFDCEQFSYKDRMITGFCCAVKMYCKRSYREAERHISIRLTEDQGFIIQIDCLANKVKIQPYKVYVLALCENLEEELIEISYSELMEYSEYMIESVNASAESTWTIDKG